MTAADYIRQSERLEPSHVGPRLRAERERQGLSLREIAKRVGVSASLVSQIERDKVAPSRQHTLGAREGTRPQHGRPVRRRRRTDTGVDRSPCTGSVRAGIGEARDSPRERRDVGAANGGKSAWRGIPPCRSMRPGASRVLSTLSSGTPAWNTASANREARRSGRIRTYNLGPGDSVSFDGSLPHRLWAIGDEPAEAIWAVVGRHGVVSPT